MGVERGTAEEDDITRSAQRVALVTGASRGIGAEVARILADRGVTVIITYRNKARRAERVAGEIRARGGAAEALRADLTSVTETDDLFVQVSETVGHLDMLVLNASGGLERGKDATYATELDESAQVRAVELALPLMAGGRVVFVTSHFAHFYGERPVYPGYEVVAASKNAGEAALRSRIPLLGQSGVTLVVVSGDLIEGTITPMLLERASPGLIESRRRQAGGLPSVEEFARAVADAAEAEHLESGATIFVGSIE